MFKGLAGFWFYLILAVLALAGAAVCIFILKKTAPGEQNAGMRNRVRFEIRDSDSGKLYGRWFIKDGGEFAIEFVHSVNNSPVRETFRVVDKRIQLVSVRFYSFGAGMSSDLEEGQVMGRDGDAMVISGFNRSFSELRYIVGTVSDHLLFINGETISLRDLCGRNSAVIFTVFQGE
jgi:hypothetical protein